MVNYIPGSSSEIGDYLIDHKDTSLISFTGSRDVGVSIYERAAKVQKAKHTLNALLLKWVVKIQLLLIQKAT